MEDVCNSETHPLFVSYVSKKSKKSSWSNICQRIMERMIRIKCFTVLTFMQFRIGTITYQILFLYIYFSNSSHHMSSQSSADLNCISAFNTERQLTFAQMPSKQTQPGLMSLINYTSDCKTSQANPSEPIRYHKYIPDFMYLFRDTKR